MIRNPDFLLRDVADTLVIVPVGAATEQFPGMITVNATGAWIWEQLEREQTVDSLVTAMTGCYEVDVQTARQDITAFVQRLIPVGAILES